MVSEAAASTCKSSTRGRCPDIHRHVDNRRNKASSPRRCLQEGNDAAAAIARPGTRSLGFLPESCNHRGGRRSSTTSVSKKKNDAGAPPLPAPTRSVLGFRPEHLHATPKIGRPSLLLSTATKQQHIHLVSSTKTSCPGPQARNLLAHTSTNQQAVAPQAKTTGRASSLQPPTGAAPPRRHPRTATPGAPHPPRAEHAAQRTSSSSPRCSASDHHQRVPGRQHRADETAAEATTTPDTLPDPELAWKRTPGNGGQASTAQLASAPHRAPDLNCITPLCASKPQVAPVAAARREPTDAQASAAPRRRARLASPVFAPPATAPSWPAPSSCRLPPPPLRHC
jgi:hypothetical protein